MHNIIYEQNEEKRIFSPKFSKCWSDYGSKSLDWVSIMLRAGKLKCVWANKTINTWTFARLHCIIIKWTDGNLYNLLFTRKECAEISCGCAFAMLNNNVSRFKTATIIIKISVLSPWRKVIRSLTTSASIPGSGSRHKAHGTSFHLSFCLFIPEKKKNIFLAFTRYSIRLLIQFSIFIDNFIFRNIFNFVIRRHIDHILDIHFFFSFRECKMKTESPHKGADQIEIAVFMCHCNKLVICNRFRRISIIFILFLFLFFLESSY